MKKRLLSTMLALVLSISLLSGCSTNNGASKSDGASTNNGASKDNTQSNSGSDEKKTYRIAVLLSGYRGDGAYNDYVYAGVQQAEEKLPVEVKFIESNEAADWENNLIAMATEDYDLVMGASNQYQDIIQKQAPNFPKVNFALVDGFVDLENVVSVTFSFPDGGFLAGAAAAIIANSPDIPGITGSKTVGFVAGMEIPIMQQFYAGYEAGVHYIDPSMKVLSAYAGTFNDPLKGKELAYAQFDQGADVIVQSAAGTGNGIMEVALEKGKYVIGLDVFEQGPYLDTMATNVYRHIDEAVFNIIESVVQEKYEGGLQMVNEAASGMVSLYAWDNFKRIIGDKFPAELETKIDELEQMFMDGKIVIEDGVVVVK